MNKTTQETLPRNQKEIKILVAVRHPVGGIRTYLKYTHGNLDKNIYEISILIDSNEWLKSTIECFKGFCISVFSPQKNSNTSTLLSMFFLLMRNKYHIIHSQGLTSGMISVVANMIFRRRHVITLHQVFGKGYSIDKFFEKYPRLKKFIIQVILGKADIIQCVSNDAKENLLDFFPGLRKKAHKIIAIRNGINIDTFDNPKNAEIRLFEKSDDKFYVGFLGRYMPHKGFQYVIDAIDTMVNDLEVKDIKVLSGGGSSGFINRYRREITKRNLDEYFEFLAFVENVAPILRHVNLLLIPSLAEACPLLPMEALVCGTPVVAFSCIGLREVLKNTPARMVSMGDLDGLVKEILDIKKLYIRTKMEFDNFITEARERFDAKTVASTLDELFMKLVKNSPLKNI